MKTVHMVGVFALLCAIVQITALAQHGPARSGESFGTPIEAYEVRPGFVLSVHRIPTGEIEEMVVQAAQQAGRTDHLPEKLTREIALELIEQLVPAEKRGAKGQFYALMTCAGGCADSFDYDNVEITYYSYGDRAINQPMLKIRWRNGIQP
jgi:hypothetical protein